MNEKNNEMNDQVQNQKPVVNQNPINTELNNDVQAHVESTENQVNMEMNSVNNEPTINNTGLNNPIQNDINQSYQQPSISNKKSGDKKMLIIAIVAIVAIIAVVAIVFLNKGGQTLTCTMEDNYSGMDMNMEAKFKFKSGAADSVKVKMTIDLGEYSDYKDYFVESLEKSMESSKVEGFDYDVKTGKDNVVVTMTADKENFAAANISVSATDYAEVKKELEESGFKCK